MGRHQHGFSPDTNTLQHSYKGLLQVALQGKMLTTLLILILFVCTTISRSFNPMALNVPAVLSNGNSSIHWYSYGKKPREPQEISLEFLVLTRLLPDIRILWREETGLMETRAQMQLERFPADIRILMSKNGDKSKVDLENDLLVCLF